MLLALFCASFTAYVTASAPLALAQEPPLRTSPVNPEHCGLGKAFHAGRRAALREKLKDGFLIVRGVGDTRAYEPFHQDKTFWYLTGIESPNATLVVDCKSGAESLFLPKGNAMSEMWVGEIWDASDAWIPELTGFSDIRPNDELMAFLKEHLTPETIVWISKEPHVELAGCYDRAHPYDLAVEKDPLDGRESREKALEDKLRTRFSVEAKDCTKELGELRRVKTPEEIDAMRRAAHAGSLAMIEALRSTKPGVGEWQLDALMSFVHRREGAAGPAYQAIVGSGPNALVLHYSACTRTLQPGEMLLIDYAPEFDHYTCDITRSWPTDGQFTPRMKEIYDAVLEAQEAGIAVVKPGVFMRDIDKACRGVLSKYGMSKLMPHGACHYIGMEVHDVGDGQKALVPGCAITVEPGVYEQATGIGVRIEDVVLVTESGCEVLSKLAPKDRATLTARIAEPGLLKSSGAAEAAGKR